jgi:hypothetical protein
MNPSLQSQPELFSTTPSAFAASPGSPSPVEITPSAGSELHLGVGGDSKPKPKAKNRHPMDRATKPHENKFHVGNGEDGKHYWLTPPALRKELQDEFEFDMDVCPFPKPADFDALTAEWGQSNYANIPFGSVIGHDGKKKGPTAWARKAIAESRKGKRVVLLYPIDKWILMMLAAGAEVRNLGDVRWCATEDGSQGKGTGRHIAAFILHGHELKECVSDLPKGKDSPRHDATENQEIQKV